MSPKRFCLAALALSCLVLPGCSMGFTNLKPGENSIYYASLFHDVINTYDEPYWLWIRGTAALDYNGDGKVEEEAVLATIQQGSERRPGQIEAAFLLICRVGQNKERTTIARTLLFDKNPIPGAPRPANDLGIAKEIPLTRAKAQVVEDKTSFRESVVVYFWGDEMPGTVWYAGFGHKDGTLAKNFEVAMWQDTAGCHVVNLDKTVAASPFGYQIAFAVAAIPREILAKLDAVRDAPQWGHVYARDEEGMYRQADARFGEHYKKIENSWNQLYLKAVMHNLPPGELAWFEYHLGLLNHYTGESDMAKRLLDKASRNAGDETLKSGIGQALKLLSEEDATAWKPYPEDSGAGAVSLK